MSYQPMIRNVLAVSLLFVTWGCTDTEINKLKERFAADPSLNGATPSVAASASPSSVATAAPSSVSATPTPQSSGSALNFPVEVVVEPLPLKMVLSTTPIPLKAQVKMNNGQLIEGVTWTVDNATVAKIEGDTLQLLAEGQVKLIATAKIKSTLQRELYLTVGGSVASVAPSTGSSTAPSPSPSTSANDGFTLSTITGSFYDLETGNNKLYVSDQTKNQVHVIDTLTGKLLASVQVSSAPAGMDLSPDGSRLYVASSGLAGVDVIDTNSNTKLETIPVDFKAYDVVSSHDRIYVSFGSTNNFDPPVAIDLTTKEKVATFPKGVDSVSRLLITKDNSTVYVGKIGGSPASLYKVDVTANPPKLVIEDEHGAIGSNMRGLALSADEQEIYLACGAPYNIQILNVTTFKPAGLFDTGYYPESVAISPDGKYVFGAHASRDIKVFDRTTQQMLMTPKFGYEVRRVVVSSDGKRVFGIQDRGSKVDALYQLLQVDKIINTPAPTTLN